MATVVSCSADVASTMYDVVSRMTELIEKACVV